MERLLYISTSCAGMVGEDVPGILRASRRNNAAAGLTGLLVTGGRRFLQVLEGPGDAIDRTFTRIRADPRHHAIVILSRGPIARRSFADWSMGHVESGDDAHTLDHLLASIDDPNLRAYFDGFGDIHRAA